MGPFRSELTKLIRAVEEVPVPQKWARMPSWWWWWVFPLSLLNIIIWYNKWGWRPYAADPWDQLAQSCKPCLYLPFGTATLGSRTLRLAGGVRLAHLKSKDAAAAPKHHGSEGQIGPAAGSPDCQTSLSERLETSCKPCLYLPFGTATLGPRTLPQHQNTMAVRDGSGPRPAAETAKRRFLNA